MVTASVEYPVNGETGSGYLARPKDGRGPGLVVIQEWWGLNDHIRDVTGRFAREGYVALAPDLYHGKVTEEPDDARKLAMELEHPRAIREIASAARYLKSRVEVEPKKAGVVGWCMGGRLAFAAAHLLDDFAAVVGFYGRPPSDEEVARINCPVLGLFGELDGGISPELAEAFRASLVKHNKSHEIHIYPGAPHAFFNDARPHIFKADAAQDAWQKTLRWFEMYLK